MWRKLTWGIAITFALVAFPAYWLSALVWSSIETERYYRARPILQAMRRARDGDSLKADAAREVLLMRFPLGTAAKAVVDALSREEFHCQRLTRTSPNPIESALRERAGQIRKGLGQPAAPMEREHIVCQLSVPTELASTAWIVKLTPGTADELTNVDVTIGGISF